MTVPVEILLGIYLGLLTGIVPAFVAGSLGFVVRYFTGVTLPGFGVVVLALSIASVQGGLLGLVQPDIAQSPRLLVAVLIVLMLSLYAHNQGDKLGQELPRRLSFTSLRQRTLSADVVELVGTVGQVTVRPTGEIRDMQGYPSLPSELRGTLKAGSWKLPADLPLSELEARLADRLRTDHELADVDVTIDEHARATIAAAPPSGGLSRRVPEGQRAVSLATLAPTGLARGDAVAIRVGEQSITGTVLSVRTEIDAEQAAADAEDEPDPDAEPAAAEDEPPTTPPKPNQSTAGGLGRVTVAVPHREVPSLLEADAPRLRVQSQGTSRAFEALALIKRAGSAIRRLTVDSPATVDAIRDAEDVTVLAVRRQGSDEKATTESVATWTFAPDADAKRQLDAGDEVFLAGPVRTIDDVLGTGTGMGTGTGTKATSGAKPGPGVSTR